MSPRASGQNSVLNSVVEQSLVLCPATVAGHRRSVFLMASRRARLSFLPWRLCWIANPNVFFVAAALSVIDILSQRRIAQRDKLVGVLWSSWVFMISANVSRIQVNAPYVVTLFLVFEQEISRVSPLNILY